MHSRSLYVWSIIFLTLGAGGCVLFFIWPLLGLSLSGIELGAIGGGTAGVIFVGVIVRRAGLHSKDKSIPLRDTEQD